MPRFEVSTNSTEQSPCWEANSRSATQLPAHMEPKCSLPCSQQPNSTPVLSQMNTVHTLTTCFSYLWLGLPSGIFLSDIPLKIYVLLICPVRAKCPIHIILLHFITLILVGEEHKLYSSSLYSFLTCPDISPFSKRVPISFIFHEIYMEEFKREFMFIKNYIGLLPTTEKQQHE